MRLVYLDPCNDEALNAVYGESKPGPILLPDGINGAELWSKCKQTDEERRECLKRGAEFIEPITQNNINPQN
jgi:hypothetical protein